jgi:CRP-like cAMP-binding protein
MAKSNFANAILAQLPTASAAAICRHLQPVELPVKKLIYQPNEPIRQVYFVETGMVSVVSIMENGGSIEVGTIGSEGVVGATILMGVTSVPYQQYVQLGGHGLRLDAAILKGEALRNAELRDLILRSQFAFLVQSMQCTACIGTHDVTQRCCRWLLMSRDRTDSDTLTLTHEFLALMLGVRRASVTDLLKPIQKRGWIQMNRGEITILDRKGLESGSCECYRIIREQQKQMAA